jgi:kinesin family member 11
MGIIPRSVHTIFEQLESLQADYTVRVSFLELYNEELAVRYAVILLHKQ